MFAGLGGVFNYQKTLMSSINTKKYKKKELEIICEEIDKKTEEVAKEKVQKHSKKYKKNK